MLEFALVLPVLLLVAFGVLDLGRVFFATITLTNAAREGARYLARHPDDAQGDFYKSTLSVTTEAGNGGISVGAGDVTVSCTVNDDDPNDKYCESGLSATVTVTHTFELVLGWFLPNPTITRSAVMVIP